MLKKIIDTVMNFSVYHIYSFACKNFYLMVATAGLFHIGIGYVAKDTLVGWKQTHKLSDEDALKLMYVVAAIVMVLALIINSPGYLEKPAYYFYGRYYEYLVGPIVFIGIEKISERRLTWKGVISITVILFLSGWGALQLETHLNNPYLYFDSNRIAAFAYCAYEKIMYGDVICYWIIFILIAIVIMLGLNYFEKSRKLVLLVPLVIFQLNNIVIEGTILNLHRTNTDFYEVATFIHANYDVEEVYFLSGETVEEVSYAGVQSLLGKERLIIIQAKDAEVLEKGDLIITYLHNSPIEELELAATKIGATQGYAIYLVP